MAALEECTFGALCATLACGHNSPEDTNHRQRPRSTCLRTLCPTKRYGPGISHDDEAVPQGHRRQEALDAFPSAPYEGQAQKYRLSRGSLDGYPWTRHQHSRCELRFGFCLRGHAGAYGKGLVIVKRTIMLILMCCSVMFGQASISEEP